MTRVKVLISGVAGFVGSNVARKFRDFGHDVIGVDDLSSGFSRNVPDGVDFIQGDLSDRSIFSRIPNGCEVILHLAGQSSGEISFDNPVADLHKNTISTLNLIDYGKRNASKKLVLASSMSVYGNTTDAPVSEAHHCHPLSCYGSSKLAAENYLAVFKDELPFVALRMFNVFGPGQDMGNLRQGMLSIYLAQALRTGRVEIKGSLNRFRDFIFIDDVVEVWWAAAFDDRIVNQTLNVGTGVKTTVKNLIDLIKIRLPQISFFVSEGTPGDQAGIVADITVAQTFGLLKQPVSLIHGLDAFLKHSLSTNLEGELAGVHGDQ